MVVIGNLTIGGSFQILGWLYSISYYVLHLSSVVFFEEIDQQPLIQCRWAGDSKGSQLGESSHIQWARQNSGPALSFPQWSMYVDAKIIAQQHDIRCGVTTHISKIEDAFPDLWRNAHNEHDEVDGWWGCFEGMEHPQLTRCGLSQGPTLA